MSEPIRCYEDLVDYIRARKDDLGLSNAFVDEFCGMTPGYCDKLLGPSGTKGLSRFTLDYFFAALAFELVPRPNAEQEAMMRPRWEGREKSQVRVPRRVSKAIMERARPMLLAILAKSGGLKRAACLPGKRRSEIARKAARVRWRMAKARARAMKAFPT